MVSLSQVEDQLKRVGCNFRFWGRPEIRELCHILMDGEVIAQAVNGRYENGFAMLCATDHRLLLIDKKPMFLTLEDVRFDMIAEIDFNNQLFDSTVKIITPNRNLVFTTPSQQRLRKILNYTQQRVSEIRQHYMQPQMMQYQSERPYEQPTTVHSPYNTNIAEGSTHLSPSMSQPSIGWTQAQQWQQQQASPPPREDDYAYAPSMGTLALQGDGRYVIKRLPINPYTKTPLTMRKSHRRIPKFY